MAGFYEIVVLLAFGIIGCCCYGMDQEPCQYGEYESTASLTKICENKKSLSYMEIESQHMDTFLEENKDWMSLETNENSFDVDINKVEFPHSGSKENCYSVPLEITPYMVEVDNKPYYIIQSAKFNFLQKLTYVKCKNQEADCFTNIFGYNSDTSPVIKSCKERTAAMSLYAYDIDKKNVVLKRFDIPIACTCLMKRVM